MLPKFIHHRNSEILGIIHLNYNIVALNEVCSRSSFKNTLLNHDGVI